MTSPSKDKDVAVTKDKDAKDAKDVKDKEDKAEVEAPPVLTVEEGELLSHGRR